MHNPYRQHQDRNSTADAKIATTVMRIIASSNCEPFPKRPMTNDVPATHETATSATPYWKLTPRVQRSLHQNPLSNTSKGHRLAEDIHTLVIKEIQSSSFVVFVCSFAFKR
jgi:hypothetical protein